MGQLSYLHHLLDTVVPAIHKARQTQVNQFANVSRITLLLYDILLNLDREKRLVWEAKFGFSSLLYYVLRYPVIAFQFFTIFLSPTLPHCDALYKFTFTISITLTRIAICASFILRVYAVLPKGIGCYMACAFLSAVGILSVALDIVQTTEQSCHQSSSPIWLVLTFICLICFDVISTALMCWGIFCLLKDGDEGMRGMNVRRLRRRWRLPAIIMRSGILYYLVITGLQLGAIILYWLPQGVYSLVLNNYLTPLSTILVSRFLLDLRELVNNEPSYHSNLEPGIQFALPSGSRDSHSKTLTMGWMDEFEFEARQFTKSEQYLEPEYHLNSMGRPLEDLIERGRRVEERLNAEAGTSSDH